VRDDDDSFWYFAACGTVLVAAAIARSFGLDASLFEDEVWVARLVRDGGWRPHAHNTPIAFYVLERGWIAIRGFSDAAMRQLPAFFGVALAALPLAADRLAPGLTDRTTRFTWAVLLAASSPLLYYATRVKQYTIEAFVAALLLLLFFGALESRRRAIAFFATAIVAVMTLVSPFFIVAAAGITLFTTRHRTSPLFLAGFAATAVAFNIAYFGWLAPGPESARLHGDMDAWFTETGRWMDRPSLIVPATLHWLGQTFNLVPFWWLVIPLLIAVSLRRHWRVLVFAALPPLLILLASAAHKYPYSEVRLMTFTFPAIYLAVALALARLRLATLVLLIPFVVAASAYDRTYMGNDADLHPLFDFVVRSRTANEPIFTTPSLAAPLLYHHPALAPHVRPMPASGNGWVIAPAREVKDPLLIVGDTAVSRR
jgi:hypothetical protein